ncbi:hypothetical protein [Wolbachia endosymbiont of Dirofilaria (Dirofilaria) immitis]|nr:hypothetical protein [Wolbachia endosymbiont of Dirofilaria (Dirofilaria) immitis]
MKNIIIAIKITVKLDINLSNISFNYEIILPNTAYSNDILDLETFTYILR